MLKPKIKETELVDKSANSRFMDNSDKKIKRCNDTRIATLAKKSELKAEQNKIVTLHTHDLNYFLCKIIFDDYGFRLYLLVSQHLIR